jgi:hypothetical protein
MHVFEYKFKDILSNLTAEMVIWPVRINNSEKPGHACCWFQYWEAFYFSPICMSFYLDLSEFVIIIRPSKTGRIIVWHLLAGWLAVYFF